MTLLSLLGLFGLLVAKCLFVNLAGGWSFFPLALARFDAHHCVRLSPLGSTGNLFLGILPAWRVAFNLISAK
jgi:hypothetical protein